MAFYTAYIPPAEPGEPAPETLARAEVLKDGYSFPAFIFTGLWLIYKRLWLAALVYAALYGLLVLAQVKLGLTPTALAICQFALGLYLGLEGHALRGNKLLKQGWQLADVVEARNQDEAERRFFERALLDAPMATATAASPAPRQNPALSARPQGVIGLFPEATLR
jgi:hypothetical protein